MQTTTVATDFHNLPLNVLIPSKTNPRRIVEDDALRELADYVPGHIIYLMFHKRLCGRCGGKPHGWWRCAF
jgi:hypothetical protein